MKKALFSLFAVVTLATGLFASDKPATSGAELGKWTMDIPAALALAKDIQKPVLVNFTGSDWCMWCQMMDKKVFSQEAWQTWAKDNLVLIWVDFPRDKTLVPEELQAQNKAYSEKFGIQGFPSYIVLDPDGNQIGRLGADRNATPELFIARTKNVLITLYLDKLLSGEDYAEYQKLQESMKDLNLRLDAWQLGVRAQAAVFQKEQNDLSEQIEALKQKAFTLQEQQAPAPAPEGDGATK